MGEGIRASTPFCLSPDTGNVSFLVKSSFYEDFTIVFDTHELGMHAIL